MLARVIAMMTCDHVFDDDDGDDEYDDGDDDDDDDDIFFSGMVKSFPDAQVDYSRKMDIGTAFGFLLAVNFATWIYES